MIASIAGFCLGGGFGLAAACDLRVANRSAVFGVPAAKLGVGYPPAAVNDIVRMVGVSAAKDLFFTARRIDAQDAYRLGAVDRLVDDMDLAETTQTLAAEIAANAPLTQRAAKSAINAAAGDTSISSDELIKLADACFDSDDFAEGRAAFLERRPAVFQGR